MGCTPPASSLAFANGGLCLSYAGCCLQLLQGTVLQPRVSPHTLPAGSTTLSWLCPSLCYTQAPVLAAVDEELIKKTADLMVELGLKDAGYEYLVVDGARGEQAAALLSALLFSVSA